MNDLHFMPHQEDALNRTEQFNRCAYYLDMGLGKTFVGAEKMYLLNNVVNVVICQKSKIDDWIQHFKEYYPSDRVMNLTKKSEAINFRTLVDTKELYNKDVQIIGVINYETAFRRDWLLKLKGFTLMLDESSLITNETAQRSKFILKMQPESVILLSGTPTAGKYERLEYVTTDGDTKPIRGSKMNHQVVDGVLNFFVNYDFFTVKTEDQTPMETMTASTDVKEGG